MQVPTNIENMPVGKKVKLNFVFPEQLESKFANHLIVQDQQDCFTLSFFETILPAILGESEEERKTAFEKINTVNSNCIARFVITPEKMPAFIKIMQESLNNHERMIALAKQTNKENK